jgi:CheY-like chemotaxis protein
MNVENEKTLLVVDDEERLRRALEFEFTRKGYRVLKAENGRAAQEILDTHKVDIVLSDVRMPGGDGVELLKWIQDHQSQTPCVIFITAFTDLSTEEAYHLGAEAVFNKPFDSKVLGSAVDTCLATRNSRWQAPVADESLPVEIVAAGPVQLGKGGMFVPMLEAIPKSGTPVQFHFQAVLTGIVEGRGIVRWSRYHAAADHPAGYGIEFVALSDHCRDAIVGLVETGRAGKSFIPIR